jgi:hypothetical protein
MTARDLLADPLGHVIFALFANALRDVAQHCIEVLGFALDLLVIRYATR